MRNFKLQKNTSDKKIQVRNENTTKKKLQATKINKKQEKLIKKQ